jgi:hypothetical protein
MSKSTFYLVSADGSISTNQPSPETCEYLTSSPYLSITNWRKDSDLQIGGTPHAAYDASTCDPYNFFSAQTLVLNVNLCGMSSLLLPLLLLLPLIPLRR